MREVQGHCMNGQLERGQVGDPCLHVVRPFTSERLVCLTKFLFIQIYDNFKIFCSEQFHDLTSLCNIMYYIFIYINQ